MVGRLEREPSFFLFFFVVASEDRAFIPTVAQFVRHAGFGLTFVDESANLVDIHSDFVYTFQTNFRNR
jgi:hypothetical protein